ncbi:MAG: hypothetical protein VX785_00320 [Actinomycetota bacterium]|nr:hypothetical protein [Actinomycetota bacterium]MED5551128.1 hypothetical protein [Actinomycetota bacterium]MEE2680536.1 hypothetical protein [Actinomycetota bacterium]
MPASPTCHLFDNEACVIDRTPPSEVLPEALVQGVIKAYDPQSKTGVVVEDVDRTEYDLALDALEGSIFRMVRQGQRIIFDLNEQGLATQLRLGSEVDLGTPDWITAAGGDA